MTPNTAWLILLALLLLYEVWAMSNKTPGDTLSEAVWRMARRPVIPFVAGLVCGHLFWQSQGCIEAFWK